MKTKKCSTCREKKPVSEFHKERTRKGGRAARCKPCKKAYDAQPERLAARKQYKKERGPLFNHYSAKRRQIIYGTRPDIDSEEHARIEELYKLREWLTEATGIPHEVDHIVPLCAGGEHRLYNLQLLYAKENRAKGGRANL